MTIQLEFGENERRPKFVLEVKNHGPSISSQSFTYFINSNNELTFGGDLIYYRFNPADAYRRKQW
jgi:hypothetical protein